MSIDRSGRSAAISIALMLLLAMVAIEAMGIAETVGRIVRWG